MIKSEKQFADFLESQGKTYFHQPKTFRFNSTSYRPDFYCPEDNIYYEVKTYLSHKDVQKLLSFKKYFPNIKLKVVSPNGFPYYSVTSYKFISALNKIHSILTSKDIFELTHDEHQFLRTISPKLRDLPSIQFNRIRIDKIKIIKKQLGIQ